jgi:hypothetical protein
MWDEWVPLVADADDQVIRGAEEAGTHVPWGKADMHPHGSERKEKKKSNTPREQARVACWHALVRR